jgi:hypothetical protein
MSFYQFAKEEVEEFAMRMGELTTMIWFKLPGWPARLRRARRYKARHRMVMS